MSFSSVSESKRKEILNRIRESFPTSCICWIEKIENAELDKNYNDYKKSLKSTTNELSLFHGTNEENITPIMKEGFNPDKNKRSALGKGTYFAKNAGFSMDYTSSRDDLVFMFLCDVLIDDMTREDQGRYVSPHRHASIPRYVIAFHKNRESLEWCVMEHNL